MMEVGKRQIEFTNLIIFSLIFNSFWRRGWRLAQSQLMPMWGEAATVQKEILHFEACYVHPLTNITIPLSKVPWVVKWIAFVYLHSGPGCVLFSFSFFNSSFNRLVGLKFNRITNFKVILVWFKKNNSELRIILISIKYQ